MFCSVFGCFGLFWSFLECFGYVKMWGCENVFLSVLEMWICGDVFWNVLEMWRCGDVFLSVFECFGVFFEYF